MPRSKSTCVSAPHTASRSSSRLTTSPALASSNASAFAGCGSSATARPFFRSSPVSLSNSKTPNLCTHDPLYSTARGDAMGEINIAGVLKGGWRRPDHEHERVRPERAGGRRANDGGAGGPQPATGRRRGRSRCSPSSRCCWAFVTVWLYAAIRPRFGPGPKTAICAGLIVWGLSYLYRGHRVRRLGINRWASSSLIIALDRASRCSSPQRSGGYLYNES